MIRTWWRRWANQKGRGSACDRIRRGRPRPVALELLEDRTLLSFAAAIDYDVGSLPYSLALDDFNNDGKLDLVTANSNSNTVSVLLGNGDGTFQTARSYGTGTTPYGVAVGDFNGDGKLDLVVANFDSNNLSVLFGNGDGTFQAPRNFGSLLQPRAVAVGDFNGDGKLDLAVANRSNTGGTMSVFLGNGNGTFQTATNYDIPAFPFSVTVGDLNGDGHLDLMTANSASGNISVLLGNGDGSFQSARNFPAGIQPYSVAVGDFNGDGVPDLAVANFGYNPSGNESSVSVLLGNGDGSFRAARNYTVGNGSRSVAVGDFDGDGYLDLAVANSRSHNVSLLRGNGDGTFQTTSSYDASGLPTALVVGDFNNDSTSDLAVVNYVELPWYPGNVTVLLGNGDGSFLSNTDYSSGPLPRAVAVGDFNGDGNLDLAVTNFYSNGSGNTVSVLLGNGDGSFQPPVSYGVGINPISVAVGDFNGDGIPDLVVANSGSSPQNGGVTVLLGNGDGTFRRGFELTGIRQPNSVTVGDFDGDGHLDFAIATYTNGYVYVFLNDGTGSFQNYMYPQSVGSALTVADMNGDGYPDIVTNSAVLLGNGDGTFGPPIFMAPGEKLGVDVVVGDFLGDGSLQLAGSASLLGQDGHSVNVARILYDDPLCGSAHSCIHVVASYAVGWYPTSLVVADFNHDGHADIATVNNSSNDVSILLGNGNGTFRSKVNYAVGHLPFGIAAGDFNGDGYPDLVTTNFPNNNSSVLLNAADGRSSPSHGSCAAHVKPHAIRNDLAIVLAASVDSPPPSQAIPTRTTTPSTFGIFMMAAAEPGELALPPPAPARLPSNGATSFLQPERIDYFFRAAVRFERSLAVLKPLRPSTSQWDNACTDRVESGATILEWRTGSLPWDEG